MIRKFHDGKGGQKRGWPKTVVSWCALASLRTWRNLGVIGLSLVLGHLALHDSVAQRGRIAPEAATGRDAKSVVVGRRFMVSAANPYASQAGADILRRGGSAVDAAIAVQMVLNLVEPQSSGIGGGAFLVHYDATTKKIVTYDGRETAPKAARPDRFLSADGAPLPYGQVVPSGLSVGVPGTIAMLADAHAVHGVLPWADLFQPAIQLARDGFIVSSRLHLSLMWFGADRFSPAARAYFFPDGAAVREGRVLKNEAFAATLEQIAQKGVAAFYSGTIAAEIVAAVATAELTLGDLTLDDLAGYTPIRRAAVCTDYRRYKICGMGPPSSGALTVAQTLKLIEPFASEMSGRPVSDAASDAAVPDAAAKPVPTPEAKHLIAEAQKLAYADRNAYIADPDFVTVPHGLLDADYLQGRRALISAREVMTRPKAGVPPGLEKPVGDDETRERPGTSHISIVDVQGHAVSMTTTIEGAFGSGLWAAGFLLNNELTDFSFRPVDGEGQPIANAVDGGKRPRSSMAPTIVLNEAGELEAVLGSPGGSRIILYVTKALVGMIDWKLNAQQATDLVNFGSRGGAFEIEVDQAATPLALRLKALGHEIRPDVMVSGLHIIQVRRDAGGVRLEGGADPRREGVAIGN